MVDGQIAINYASGAPGMFFKDSNGSLVKVGPVHVGSGAPNAVPASGGTAGNSIGEQWLDTSGGTYVFKIWDGAAWRSEAGEFVNATGDTMTGDLVMNNANVVFEGSVDDGFETTLTVVNPTADRTITLPNVTGTVVTTGDSGTVTSTMIADGTIVNADVNASAAIAGTKISPDFGSQNRTSTGTSTAASFIPTSSSVPTNGVYLPSTNNVAISTNGTGRLFVDASGNVGIGTASPSVKLEVSGSGGSNPEIRCVDGTINSQWYQDSAGYSVFGTFSNHPQVFRTNGTERARIDSSGRLGLGTSSPGAVFQIVSSTSADQMRIGASTTEYYKIGRESTNGKLTFEGVQQSFSGYDFKIYPSIGSAATSALVIKEGSGNVGIGTTSPSSNLTVGGNPPIGGAIAAVGSAAGIALALSDNTNSSLYVRTASGGAIIGTDTGGTIRFATSGNDTANEKARIDDSGRLLVGTSSAPSAGYGQYARIVIQGYTGNALEDGALSLQRGETAANITTGENIGRIAFNDSAGNTFADILCSADANAGSNDYPGRLVFSTTADGASSPTERMRITSAGSAQFAAATTGIVSGSVSGAGTTFTTFIGQHSTASGPGTGTNSFLVYTNGDVQNTNNSYGALSDLKLKENIVDALSQWDDIKALQVRKYNFKEGQTHTQIGLIAQEVELVSPGLVTESPDRDAEGNDLGTVTKSVNYSVLYMKAVKALQEAMERIETLEAKVAALEGV
jgi:hypothetical protein